MHQVKLDSGFNIEVEFSICPFHKRFFAWLMDVVIIIAYVIIGVRSLTAIFGETWQENRIFMLLFFLPPSFYGLACEILMNGQSVGKKAMNIRVIAADGGQPSLSQFLIRWVFRLVDFPIWIWPSIIYGLLPGWSAILILPGLICVLVSPLSQRIGDLVAGTILISTKTKTSWEDTVFTEVEDNYQPRFPQVMQLSDKDINTLKSIIESVKKKSDYDLSMRIGERIKSKLQISSDQDSLDFLETLLKDYNYYVSN